MPTSLRSPWKTHAWLSASAVAIYGLGALAAWSGHARAHGLGPALVMIMVVLFGLLLGGALVVSTAMVAVFARRPHPLLKAYGVSAAVVATLLATWIALGA